MKIALNTSIYNSKPPSFKSISGFYRDKNKKEMGFYSWFFRRDLPWETFTDYTLDHFQNKDKVNIVHFGSSDGSEAFSHILSLMANKKNADVEKYFPIRAYDIKDSLVKMAQSGYININSLEYISLTEVPLWNKFFKPVKNDKSPFLNYSSLFSNMSYITYTVDSTIKDKVKFQQGNMFDILPKFKDDSNSIIFCRNCLSYFKVSEVKTFIRNLSQVLKKDSLFCIGELEHSDEYIEEILKHKGFQKVMLNVYKKL